MGFIFVRFLPSQQPSLAEMLAPYMAEIAAYRLEEVKPLVPLTAEEMAVNWKAVRDVDNGGYQCPRRIPACRSARP